MSSVPLQLIIGIDPGKDGSICAMGAASIRFFDIPTVGTGKGAKREYDLAGMVGVLDHLTQGMQLHEIALAIEQANPMPKQSCVATWAQASGIYLWVGMIAARRIPFMQVWPRQWKKVVLEGFDQKDKSAAYRVATRLYPQLEPQLKTPRGRLLDGRADALCIADWARRQVGINVRPG